jgi:hypothetical protein
MDNNYIDNYFEQKKEKAQQIYDAQQSIYSPFFKQNIILNADGFHHLRYSARRERSRGEQIYRFTLLPLGLHILKTATTLQEYRKLSNRAETVEWWGFVAIFVKQKIGVRIIIRKTGNGNIHFWSIMPYIRLRNNNKRRDIFSEDGGYE